MRRLVIPRAVFAPVCRGNFIPRVFESAVRRKYFHLLSFRLPKKNDRPDGVYSDAMIAMIHTFYLVSGSCSIEIFRYYSNGDNGIVSNEGMTKKQTSQTDVEANIIYATWMASDSE